MKGRFRLLALAAAIGLMATTTATTGAAAPGSYDISTLAGKVASLRGTAGLQIRFSSFIEEEADVEGGPSTTSAPISPTNVLSSPLDGTSVLAPNVTVNQDTAAANQNETAIAVDPNNASRVVGAANDYVTRTWTCTISGTPCSALGDGYSGTYYSNDGGSTWCCASNLDGSSLGTLIPGVTHLTGGPYDAGGDPALTFDSHGHVYYAGLGFDRAAAPNTVTVNKGSFDPAGNLSWSAPTFINPTTAPSVFNDKEWIKADANTSSPFRDRVYVSWTRFLFNPANGNYVQSPIFFASSADGGATFSTPTSISGNVLYDQGSRPVVGPDGAVYVFFEGSTRQASLSSTYVVKSTDGGSTFGKPIAISQVADNSGLANTAFRVNSFPAAAAGPDGALYATWTSAVTDASGAFCAAESNDGCHSAALYSKSTDGGATWSTPALDFPDLDASTQSAVGYPVSQPSGGTLNAPAARRVDAIFPGLAVAPNGQVYLSAYVADVVSPWQTCETPASPSAVGRIDCLSLGDYVDNARLDYYVRDVTTNTAAVVSTHPINSRYGFGGTFFGDYTDIAAGPDNAFHALWTDSNNVQTVVWWYGYQFTPTATHQQDVVTESGNF